MGFVSPRRLQGVAGRPDGPLAVACLEHGDRRVVLGPVDPMGTTDLALVDDLLRLQLLTRRLGWRLHLSEVCDELRELFELVGLTGQLEDGPTAGQSSRYGGRPNSAKSSG